jgi:hypothetical protein
VFVGVTEQLPASAGHCALLEQADAVELQVPVPGQSAAVWQAALLLLHVPAGHVVVSVHVPHSLWQRLQPGGSHEVVQDCGGGGTQVGETTLHV